MERWENIIKNKLEAYESPLPEGGFARLEEAMAAGAASAATHAGRGFRYTLGIATAAVAAGLAVFLFLKGPEESEEVSVTPVAQTLAIPPAPSAESIPSKPAPAAPAQPEPDPGFVARTEQEPGFPIRTEPAAETPVQPGPTSDPSSPTRPDPEISSPAETAPPVFETPSNPVGIGHDLKVAGAGIGGLALTSMLANLFPAMQLSSYELAPSDGAGHGSPQGGTSLRHYFPFRTGLSVGFPLCERTRITSGLVYSLYTSKYDTPAQDIQCAHYLGIPLRIDLSLFSRNRCDLYIGGGLEADFCLAATRSGNAFSPSGKAEFSLLGAAGAQWLMSRHTALYLEPTLSWLPLSDGIIPETYRTDHPVMFSVIFGIRFMIDKQ